MLWWLPVVGKIRFAVSDQRFKLNLIDLIDHQLSDWADSAIRNFGNF